jgi:hypothetical protein
VETEVVDVVEEEIKLAKESLKGKSPLIGGWHGVLMRKYLRWSNARRN